MFRPGRTMVILTVAVTALFALAAFAIYRERGWQWMSIGLACVTVVLGLGGILESLIQRIELTDDAMIVTDLGGRRRYPIADIDRIQEAKGGPPAILLKGGRWVKLPSVGSSLGNSVRAWLQQRSTRVVPVRQRVGEEFDVYCTVSAEHFREGAVVTLDGIDGFFDQYFEATGPGDVIRFAVLLGGPSKVPDFIEGLDAMPFVIARVLRSDPTGADVEILSLSTLGDWSRSLKLPTQPLRELQAEFPDAPLSDLVTQSARNGSAYWRSSAVHWRSLDETSAVGVVQDNSGMRVTVIRTYAVPGLVTRVNPPAAEANA